MQAVFDELHFRHLNPSVLTEIYEVILAQLKNPEVPLGAKRSVLEFMVRQMGIEKPRKLSVKQQQEVVVRIEPTRPVQIMEALGVPVDQNALPESTTGEPFPDGGGPDGAVPETLLASDPGR